MSAYFTDLLRVLTFRHNFTHFRTCSVLVGDVVVCNILHFITNRMCIQL